MMAPKHNDDSPRAGVTLDKTLHGHTDAVVQLLWSNTGGHLVSAGIDNTIRVWDITQGVEYHRMTGQGRGVTAFALTPNQRYALTASWNAHTVEVWDLVNQTQRQLLRGHQGVVNSVQCAPDGRHVVSASDDQTLIVWHLESGQAQHTLHGHGQFVLRAIFSADGQHIISGDGGGQIIVWDIASGDKVAVLRGHAGPINDLALAPDDQTLVSASDDGTLRLWDLHSERMTSVLGGHTGPVLGVSFSADGQLLASKSADHTVQLWRRTTWENVATLPEHTLRPRGYYPVGVVFHPQQAILATLSDDDCDIRLWRLDYASLLQQARTQHGYTSRKVALVGDIGVGKTGLGYRLLGGRSSNTFATPHHYTWVLDALSHTAEDGTRCEVILWDFGRQTDHRLIHAPLLHDVDVALLLFDTCNWEDPLGGVLYWLDQLALGDNANVHKILVGTRMDAGTMMLKPNELSSFCQHHGINGGYILTSAHLDEGIESLLYAIQAQLDWSDAPHVVDKEVLATLQDEIHHLATHHELPRVFISLAELETRLPEMPDIPATLKQLENLGHIMLLDDDPAHTLVALKPDLLLDLMAAILAEARRTPLGLGTLDAARLHHADYEFLQLAGLAASEQHLLLEAALLRLEAHRIFFRQHFDGVNLLVFPQLINQKRPLAYKGEMHDDIAYRIQGASDQIYASLVVSLNMTRLFTRAYQWDHQAQFEMSPGEICGFRLQEIGPQQLEISLYYGQHTPEYTRSIFQGLFDKFLNTHKLNPARFPAIRCPNCGYRQDRKDVMTMLDQQREHMFCVLCGERIPLGSVTRPMSPPEAHPAAPPTPPRGLSAAPPQNKDNASPSAFQQSLSHLADCLRHFQAEQFGMPRCFISHAWGNPEHEQWVARLAGYLHVAGVQASYDNWDNPYVGQPFFGIQQLQDAAFVLVVGTPDYPRKYDQLDKDTGSFVVEEIEHLNARLHQPHSRASVLPILLDGDPRQVLPTPLQNVVPIRLNESRFFFIGIFNLVLALYGIAPNDPIVGELRQCISRKNHPHLSDN